METSILSKFLAKTEEKEEYFLSLEICPEKIKTAACVIKNGPSAGGVEILATGMKDYTGSWEEATLAADEVISEVEDKFPQELTVNKVVLGLPTEYTKDGKIEESHLVHIKELLTKLSLTPLGFVEIPLAIINFLQKQEGGPQTLILVRVGRELTVSLVRIGKVTDNITVPRTDNVALDLEKAMAAFTGVEILPSRILLYNGQDVEKTRQELMNYPWLTKASFLHFPKIEAAPLEIDIKAVALAGVSEMAHLETNKTETAEEPKEKTDFGFVKNQDILQKQEVVIPVPQPPVSPPKFKLPHLGNLIALLREKLIQIIPYSKKNFVYFKSRLGLIIFLMVVLLLIIGAGFVAASWYLPTAQVNLMLQSQTLNQTLEVNLNSKITAVDETTKEIPGITLEVEEKITKKAVTTGKKTVGEPAKGEVSIYNKTTNSKTFKKGTIILAPNNLKFSLDDEVTVASASGDITQPISGKVNVRVAATVIGPEGNLGVDQIFPFADFPTTSYVAKNNVAFSGGTSREISVVARADQEKTLASASTELTEQAKKDLAGKISQGEKVIDKTLTGVVTSKKFDQEIDSEANELSLELNMKFRAIGYREPDLLNILEKVITTSIPAGFEFRRDEVKTEMVEINKKKDGIVSLKANFSANLLPRINKEEIKKNLTGKSLKEAENYLRSLGNIAGFEIKFGRSVPLAKDALPRLPQNIRIETEGRK